MFMRAVRPLLNEKKHGKVALSFNPAPLFCLLFFMRFLSWQLFVEYFMYWYILIFGNQIKLAFDLMFTIVKLLFIIF